MLSLKLINLYYTVRIYCLLLRKYRQFLTLSITSKFTIIDDELQKIHYFTLNGSSKHILVNL